jgi:hypothetical protein
MPRERGDGPMAALLSAQAPADHKLLECSSVSNTSQDA